MQYEHLTVDTSIKQFSISTLMRSLFIKVKANSFTFELSLLNWIVIDNGTALPITVTIFSSSIFKAAELKKKKFQIHVQNNFNFRCRHFLIRIESSLTPSLLSVAYTSFDSISKINNHYCSAVLFIWLLLPKVLSLIHIWRCRRSTLCRSRWSPYH